MEVYNGLLFFFVVGTIIGGSFLALLPLKK